MEGRERVLLPAARFVLALGILCGGLGRFCPAGVRGCTLADGACFRHER